MSDSTGSEASALGEAALSEYVSSLGLPGDDTPAPAPRAAPAATLGAPAKPAAVVDDDLSDLDDETKPWTAERAKEVRDRVTAARDRARDQQRKASNEFAKARDKEERFKRTRDTTLELKQSLENREKMLGAIEAGLFSGDKATVLQTIGHLSKRDPLEAWTEISQAVAGGKIKKNEIPQEVIQELQYLRSKLEEVAAQGPTREKAQLIEQFRDQLVGAAAEAAEFPLTAHFAKNAETKGVIRMQLAKIKEDAHSQTGIAIDNARAFGILEERLRSQSELYQQVHAPSGQATDERDTTSPVLNQAATPGPKAATQAPSPPPRTTIPADLTGRSGGTRRALTEAERIAEIARQTPASFFRDIGLGSMLQDGEE